MAAASRDEQVRQQSVLQPGLPSARRMPVIPASYFGMVLGLGGLAGTWRAAHSAWGVPAGIGEAIFSLAALTWLLVTSLYLWKWLYALDLAKAEAAHPVHCCFIGLGGVATSIMALGALPYSRLAALILFAAGAAFTLGFGIWRTGLLWQGQREAEATTPVLLLPIVAGGFVTAIVAGALGWHEWARLAFGAAFFSWLAIESVVLGRLYTAVTLPVALRPTLGIQLAPAAVGSVAYLAIGADPSSFVPQAMLGYALLQGLLLIRLWRWITEQPFAPSYWGVTFGATALPTAFIRISAASPGHPFAGLSVFLFVIANLTVAAIALRTLVILAGPKPRPTP
jgi:tellurite resistance protein